MPLPEKFALDTETDQVPGYDQPRTVLIQICPSDAVSEREVVLWEGLDCYNKLFKAFEDTGYDTECHVFNLDYEFSRLRKEYLYPEDEEPAPWQFADLQKRQRLKPGQWYLMADDKAHYKVQFCNHYKKLLTITDDARRYPNTSMKSLAMSIYAVRPDYWPGMTAEDVKMDICPDLYNSGWLHSEHRE